MTMDLKVNAISVYQRMADPMSAVKELGGAIAKSQMFGADTESQGMILALHCLVKQCDPLSIVQSHHLMRGKLSLKSEEMLARVVKAGGDYQIIEHSPEAAEIVISYKGRKFRERFTWDEAKQEPFVYRGTATDVLPHLLAGRFDKISLGNNYATPRRRMQHLWARVVSDAVRVIAPDLIAGNYTPEEQHQALIDDGKISPATKMVDPTPESETFEAEFDVVKEIKGKCNDVVPDVILKPERVETAQEKALGKAISEISELFGLLGVPSEAQLAAIQKRGAADLGSLSMDGATDLLLALRGKLQQRSDDAKPQAVPITTEQVERIRETLKQVAQWPGGEGIGDRLRSKLNSQGFERLADLSKADGDMLENAIAVKNLELFFDASLQGYQVTRKSEDDQKND